MKRVVIKKDKKLGWQVINESSTSNKAIFSSLNGDEQGMEECCFFCMRLGYRVIKVYK